MSLTLEEEFRIENGVAEYADTVLLEAVLCSSFNFNTVSVISVIVAKRFKMVQHLIRQETDREVYVYV